LTDTEPITTSREDRDGVAVLRVCGEIDMVTASSFAKGIDDVLVSDPPSLVIDLSEVTLLASAGLRLLVMANERFGKSSGFTVAARSAAARVIELTDLDQTFHMYPTLDEAFEAVRS